MISTLKIITILLLIAFQTNAEIVKSNWSGLSKEQYVDKLVECKTAIDELNWSHSIWPKDNKTPKPPFSEIVDIDAIKTQIIALLKKQAVLSERFNLEITQGMLQQDLDRMARDTKDAKRLKQLFAVLNNDADTIAQCVSRPYLVIKKLANQFNFNNTIHKQVRINAQSELDMYLLSGNVEDTTAQVHTVNYTIKNDEDKPFGLESLVLDTDERFVIELNAEEFKQQKQQLNSNKLQEQEITFTYTEILAQTPQNLTVQVFQWQKYSQHTWLSTYMSTKILSIPQNYKLILPIITGTGQVFDNRAATADSWKFIPYVPNFRRGHTAIWSGTEMIVWGGYDGSSRINTGGRYDPVTDSWVTTSTGGNVPLARNFHTAIWSGTEMIVWGGSGNSGVSNSGGRYDPITDLWQTISTGVNVPSGRQSPTAIWSGTEMIVWGGIDNSGALNSGGRYNPVTDLWQTTSTGANVPVATRNHTAIWSGTEMIVWGGLAGVFLNSGGRYNPVTDLWQPISTGVNVPTGRFIHTAIWNGTEMIVWGGLNNSGNLNSGGRYDPVTDLWQATSIGVDVPAGRYSHTVIWSGTEMIVWGGYDGVNLNTGGRYDPVTDLWQTTSTGVNVPAGRQSHTVIWSGTEMIVWGGSDGNDLNSGGRYDPLNDSWMATDSVINVPTGRQAYTAIWSGTEMIVWGGVNLNNLNSGGRYNPATDLWQATSIGANVPTVRNNHTAIWSGTEMIVWGGFNGGVLNSGGRYNPVTDLWQATSTGANAPTGRYLHSAIWSGTEMIVWGGLAGGLLNSGGRYNPVTDLWQATSIGANVPPGRHSHTVIWSGTEMIVWGGSFGANSGGRYDPATDLWQATSIGANVPIITSSHTAIWSGTEMIVWGGVSAGFTNIGGRYNPVTNLWQATSIGANVPTGRHSHTAIWSGTEMIVWGGFDGSRLNTGGRYNPVTDLWQATSIETNVAIARQGHTAIWSGTEMIIWGGFDGASTNSMGIYYPYNTYSLSGILTGLNGDQVTLQNNGGNNLSLLDNGSFEFSSAVIEGSDYEITVFADPLFPSQTCAVTNEIGTNIIADVDNVLVDCVNDLFNVGVTVTGLAAGNSVFLENNGGDLLEVDTNNALANFSTQIGNGIGYLITFNTQPTTPDQVCSIVSGEEMGTVNATDINVEVYCNSSPVIVSNTYTAFEDITLQVNDADGSVAGVNDDSVLVNDTDIDNDGLSIVTPGTFTATVIGGEIIIAADGTFSYSSPENVSGQDTFGFEVTDGLFTVASSLNIDVLPVNDAPSFNISGDVLNASDHIDFTNNMLSITGFANNFVFGPADESGQGVAQFIPTIFADSNSVLAANGVTVNNQGDLTLEFTSNIGVAIVQLALQDDGLTTNGGEDTSPAIEFVVSYNHLMFVDSFEQPVMMKFLNDLNKIHSLGPLQESPVYDYATDSLLYFGHKLSLNGHYQSPLMMDVIKLWMAQIERVEMMK